MSPEPDAPVALPFGAAYDRLQEVAAELGQDATMAPDRLIGLLREGKGLERALRDHLERVEQEVRAIEDGDGAVPYRIEDVAPPPVAPPAAGPADDDPGPFAPAPAAGEPASRPAPPADAPLPPAPPTLGFPGADDDVPF